MEYWPRARLTHFKAISPNQCKTASTTDEVETVFDFRPPRARERAHAAREGPSRRSWPFCRPPVGCGSEMISRYIPAQPTDRDQLWYRSSIHEAFTCRIRCFRAEMLFSRKAPAESPRLAQAGLHRIQHNREAPDRIDCSRRGYGRGRGFAFIMIGAEAGEVVAAVQMAMLRGLPYTKLRDAVITHPTNRNRHTTFLNKTWGCALPKKDDSLSRVRTTHRRSCGLG